MARDRAERLDEIFRRAERVRQRESLKTKIAADVAGGGLCLAALALLMIVLPGHEQAQAAGETWRYGGLLLNSEAGGYILVAAVSMMLGVLFALLCGHIRRLKAMDREHRQP